MTHLRVWDVTDRNAVLAAIREFDELGRFEFLNKYGFGRARSYYLVHDRKQYDSKAIVAAAYTHQWGGRLRPDEFSGGKNTVKRILSRLGFDVIGP